MVIRKVSDKNEIYMKRYFSTKEAGLSFSNVFSTEFDGVDEYCQISDTNIQNNLSVFAWVKLPTTTSTECVVGQWDAAGNDRSWEIINSTNFLRIVLSDDGSSVSKSYIADTVGDEFRDNTWHHVGFTYAGNTLNVYLDGSKPSVTKGTDTAITSLHNTATPCRFGANENTGPFAHLNGKIDEIVIFENTILSETEVTELYNSGQTFDLRKHSRASDIYGWWRMGDTDTVPTIFDQVGSDDATMYNMTSTNFVEDVP